MSDATRARRRRSLVRRYYGFTLFFSLLFWLPIFYEFQRRIGLSDERIFAIQSLYYLVFCALELPTGWFADRVGHTRSLVLGAVALVASHLWPSLSPTEGGMVAHYLLIALARSLVSGASSAYAYERLTELGDRDGFKAVEGRARALGLAAKVVAWTFVGALMDRWLTGPYWLTTLAALLSLGFALALPRPPPTASAPSPGAPAGEPLRFRRALSLVRETPALGLVMGQGVALFVLQRVVQINLLQPLLRERAVPVEAYGLVLAGVSVFEALGSAWPDALRRFVGDFDAVSLLTVGMAASMLWLASASLVGSLAALALFSWVTGLSFPIQRQLFNDLVPDARYRATLLSLESLVDRAANAAVAWPLGAVVAAGVMGGFLRGAALAAVALTGLFVVLARGTMVRFGREGRRR